MSAAKRTRMECGAAIWARGTDLVCLAPGPMNHAQLVPQERNNLPNLSGPSRYELLVKVGSGGMASVYVGRVSGSAGFSRLVAVKRAHSFVLNDPAGERMMSTEA